MLLVMSCHVNHVHHAMFGPAPAVITEGFLQAQFKATMHQIDQATQLLDQVLQKQAATEALQRALAHELIQQSQLTQLSVALHIEIHHALAEKNGHSAESAQQSGQHMDDKGSRSRQRDRQGDIQQQRADAIQQSYGLQREMHARADDAPRTNAAPLLDSPGRPPATHAQAATAAAASLTQSQNGRSREADNPGSAIKAPDTGRLVPGSSEPGSPAPWSQWEGAYKTLAGDSSTLTATAAVCVPSEPLVRRCSSSMPAMACSILLGLLHVAVTRFYLPKAQSESPAYPA